MDEGIHLKGLATQQVVASCAGVSASLVSRILSGKLEPAIAVSEEKAKRIKRIADELGYQCPARRRDGGR